MYRHFANTRVVALLAVAVIVAGCISSVAAFAMSSPKEDLQGSASEAMRFQKGELNEQAVAQAQAFAGFPVLWLGKEYSGFRLTRFIRVLRENEDSVRLIYGDCVPRPGTEPSCAPPLEIVVKHHDASWTDPGSASQVGTVRGVPGEVIGPGLWLRAGGVDVSMGTNAPIQAGADYHLTLANASSIGLAPIEPGESLEPLGR